MKISSSSGYAVRHDYERAIEATARLSAYALAGGHLSLSSDVVGHCQRLAKKDLKELAISLRRLLETTDLIPFASNLLVATGQMSGAYKCEHVAINGSTNLWELLGLLVHVRSMELFDQAIDIALDLADSKLNVVADRGREPSEQITAACRARSDKKLALFFVADFTRKCEVALEAFTNCASTFGIELNVDWLDDF
jgi:hypothetical protein